MITIDLEKSLVRNKRKLLTKEEILILDKIEKIDSNKEIGELRSRLGIWSDNTTTATNAKSKLLMYDKYPKDRIFSESDIKSLCIKYGLRFLPSHYFNGELDSELPEKIKQFEKKYHNGCIGVNKYNSFIAAPTKSFKLQKRPVDPLFFVELERTGSISEQREKHYFLIHKWGNDISALRWIANLPMRTSMIANSIMVSIGILLGMYLGYKDTNAQSGFFVVFGLMGGVLMFLFSMMFSLVKALFTDDLGEPYIVGNNEKWDSPYTD